VQKQLHDRQTKILCEHFFLIQTFQTIQIIQFLTGGNSQVTSIKQLGSSFIVPASWLGALHQQTVVMMSLRRHQSLCGMVMTMNGNTHEAR